MYCSSGGGNGGGGGGTTCTATPYYGNQNCNTSGYVSVSSTYCCPPSSPYYCPSTNLCYASCEAAESAGCNNNVAYGTGQTSGGNTSGYNCVSGNCVYTSSNAAYGTETACEYSCGGSSSGYGDVTFWILSDLGCGNITVVLNGTYKTINSYYSSGAPSCNSTGCANYSLPAGTYSFTASCTDYTWSGGTVTVTNGGCSTMELH